MRIHFGTTKLQGWRKKFGVENFDLKFRKASKYELKIDLKELKIKKNTYD